MTIRSPLCPRNRVGYSSARSCACDTSCASISWHCHCVTSHPKPSGSKQAPFYYLLTILLSVVEPGSSWMSVVMGSFLQLLRSWGPEVHALLMPQLSHVPLILLDRASPEAAGVAGGLCPRRAGQAVSGAPRPKCSQS